MKKLFTMILVVLLTLTAVVSVSAAQDSFVPSVDVKDGPKVVLQTDSNGNSVAAIIYDKNGHETGSVAQGGIIITPLSGMNSAPDKVKNALQNAFNQINAADDLGELSKEIADYIKDNNLDVEIKDLVVSQLFDIRLDDEYLELLEDGGSFTVQLNVDESFLFLLMLQGNEWAICKDYKVNGSIVTLTLMNICKLLQLFNQICRSISNNIAFDKFVVRLAFVTRNNTGYIFIKCCVASRLPVFNILVKRHNSSKS